MVSGAWKESSTRGKKKHCGGHVWKEWINPESEFPPFSLSSEHIEGSFYCIYISKGDPFPSCICLCLFPCKWCCWSWQHVCGWHMQRGPQVPITTLSLPTSLLSPAACSLRASACSKKCLDFFARAAGNTVSLSWLLETLNKMLRDVVYMGWQLAESEKQKFFFHCFWLLFYWWLHSLWEYVCICVYTTLWGQTAPYGAQSFAT